MIGAGVIGDMWEPQERGGSCGVYDLESVVKLQFAIAPWWCVEDSISCRFHLRLDLLVR